MSLQDYTIENLLDLEKSIAGDFLKRFTYPWEALPEIEAFILACGKNLPKDLFEERQEGVWVAKSAKVFPSAYLGAPLIIDEGAEIRHCAFIRGKAVVGKGAVVGNSVELKNVILFDGVQTPHYNYVGDSILGHKAHMGAGSITSNVKSDHGLVVVKDRQSGEELPTGFKKFGAILGDFAEVGCNAVLNPGSVLGRHSVIYPTSMVRGCVPAESIWKGERGVFPKH